MATNGLTIADHTTRRQRWLVLAVGMLAMTAGSAYQFGLPYLIPAFRHDGLSLAQASLLSAAPAAGLLATLVAWGAAADRWGERVVLCSGLAAAGLILVLAMTVHSLVTLGVCFALAGAAGASVNASSGRLILGWFSPRERGLAMGLRQTSQPLGVGVAAVTLPLLSRSGALLFLGTACLVSCALVAVAVRDPERTVETGTQRPGSPYRTPVLWRIHAASALLVVPQFTVATFALVYLVDVHHWRASTAGQVLAIGQLCGAGARLLVGWWSDRAGSRLRPMRTVALVIALVVAALAAGAYARSGLAVAALLIGAVATVTPNGLAFTAVAEYAGRAWAGRALGIQNTAQNTLALLTAPVLGAVIEATGYPLAFAAVIVFPLVAAVLVPVAGERL
jgi:sugar phosphate permease